MREHFIVNGCRITHKDGVAEFHQYKVLIRCPIDEFTYDWVVKMEYKLSILKGII